MNQNNLTHYPYPSARRVIVGKRSAVATSQPLATLAGMEMFWAGGNAVDAALAMAIALTVVEPTSNGIGSDAFALVWDGKLNGLNASGRSPQNLTMDQFVGMDQVPAKGWLPVTVPGCVSAWRVLWERWGKLPFEQLFAPAIRYAREGFPVSPVTAMAWKHAEGIYLPLQGREFQPFKKVFFPNNRAPKAGEIWQSESHAKTLTSIAQSGGESFYKGDIAKAIANFAADTGGVLTAADLAAHQPDWIEPISTTYRNLTVWEIPPNTQGIAALIALNILDGFDLSRYPRESVESYHLQIEAMKLAFADVHRYIADPNFMEVAVEHLLDKAYAQERQKLISEVAIPLAEAGLPKGGTVYLAAADGELMVSFIQSNFEGFGSGILIPGTGIALQNRGVGFSLQAGHPNQIAPAKRSFHTIIPAFLTQDGQPLGPFGVMGGPMQPQGHLQVVVNLADYKMNPQAALDAPRWQFVAGRKVLLEQTVPRHVMLELTERGHDIEVIAEGREFGKGQIILRDGDVLIAASEPRADGLALAQ
ncbi:MULTISPECIES: gamma-glutamyltransferase family protein [unclassified Coleofasciculus]|uniref:gamma-glutamyltransferase family protein n=1 Tax=unclassified Coleofasciculus TaxID=2692782 RepID=UPI001880A709|nr:MULTISPECIES: gamma-glutamyltransferase family protein [unclassified Coleofasciculus]MBE9127185.1 gamma-glutamyltransferase family protein [Coleofasciculus sp. LEGE 07081]MBE9150295.1 gamma-glutamyltransferase family protein [Coleofasciculus sp. LEGE 07092]